jgi:hypothetical protein
MKHLKRFNEEISKEESDLSFNREEAINTVVDSVKTEGVLQKFHSEIESEVKNIAAKISDEDFKMLWYGYNLQNEANPEIPEDFDIDAYKRVALQFSQEVQVIFNKYMEKATK